MKFRGLLRNLRKNTSGNAVMIMAVGMPALIGAAGYGIDTAQWYMWKRELQHSVDQAAIAGAWALAYDEDTATWSGRALQEFDANQKLTKDFDTAPIIEKAGYDGGTDNSVIVTATASKRLPFSSFIMGGAATIRATAQASFKEGASYNACLITLKEDGTSFEVGGSANVNANCGLGALSCDDDAILIDGSATVTTTSIATCGTASVPAANQSAVAEGVTNLSDVYASTPIPEQTDNTAKGVYACGKGSNKSAYPNPGNYVGGITIKCDTAFQPGMYFIKGGTLDLTHNAKVTGYGVMFILQDGASLKLGGSGTDGSVDLTPMVQSDFVGGDYEDDKEKLAQMLFIEDKSGETDPVDHTINGNSKFKISGVLYLPNGKVKINGNSGTSTDLCFQISAYTLSISGNANLKTLCSYDSSSKLGTTASSVRLVG
ncbi:pilus assembly protein TadG-related protein [Altererythrobacter aquiaggeris]|uniref:pilus assembly protein TadG-related protein n=1 Tax=Aestuarierythrobacter aquiaggeris TaxID=1898396 RepID=UPI0030168B7D